MKRFLGILICLCLLVTSISFAEEQKEPGFFESVGNWFGQAWDDTSSWVSQAWTDSTTWVSNAWGDASKWVSQAWNDSSKWVSDIWGDVSTWASDSIDSVGVWWEETFNKSVSIDESWMLDDAVGLAFNNLRKYLFDVKVNAAQGGETEVKVSVHDLLAQLLSKLKLSEADIDKVFETIKAYSESKGISVDAMEAIMLPYLLQLANDSETIGNVNIPAIAVAQYLTGVVEKLGVKNEQEAQLLAAKVTELFEE